MNLLLCNYLHLLINTFGKSFVKYKSTKTLVILQVVPMQLEGTAEELEVVEAIGKEAEAPEEIDYKDEYLRQVEENEILKNVIKDLQMKLMSGLASKSVEEDQEVDCEDDEKKDDEYNGQEQGKR